MTTMCVNAETLEYHHEDDCTYTFLHIPRQRESTPHHLIFQLGIECNVSFDLNPSTSILFSAQYINHRQSAILPRVDNTEVFINFT